MSWLQPRKGGLYFILSDNGKYDFDVKVEHCKFVGSVNEVIGCGYLRRIFCFRITEKEKDAFHINFLFYNIPLKFFFFSHYFSSIIIMNMCVQFIITAFYDELISNKVL